MRPRTYVLTVSESQYRWVRSMVEDDRERECLVPVRPPAGLRGLKLGRGDELWVIGYPDTVENLLGHDIQCLKRETPHRVIEYRRCVTCETVRFPWCFRRPWRSDTGPEARLRRCYDCEKKAQRERDRARAEVNRQEIPDREKGESDYEKELSRYMARRREGRTRYV